MRPGRMWNGESRSADRLGAWTDAGRRQPRPLVVREPRAPSTPCCLDVREPRAPSAPWCMDEREP
ncbi:uncharacterized protein LOC128039822 [Gossypium raimondii]|uniref:uncharacterized protein LOC128039822 n=1 Tax=Gossypium raimondii TaxID=29730 RepID=UPI00227AE155|nr:uncharacterized protein LOC128039822 [Gossypium raimondii]